MLNMFSLLYKYLLRFFNSKRKIRIVLLIVAGIITATIFAIFLLLFSTILYFSIYLRIIPTISTSLPVFFDYSTPIPSATVLINGPQWISHHESTQSYAIHDSVIQYQNVYDIFLEVNVPNSPVVSNTGIVQISTNLITEESKNDENETVISPHIVATSTRPFLVHYESRLLKLSRRIAMFLPLFTKHWIEESKYRILLFNSVYNDPKISSVSLTLSYPLQTYSASLVFNVELHGFRYYLYHWFLTSALLGIFYIFFIQAFFLVFAFLLWVYFKGGFFLEKNVLIDENEQDNEVKEKDRAIGMRLRKPLPSEIEKKEESSVGSKKDE